MARNKNQRVQLIMAWLFVGIPLIWGVLQTLEKSLELFR